MHYDQCDDCVIILEENASTRVLWMPAGIPSLPLRVNTRNSRTSDVRLENQTNKTEYALRTLISEIKPESKRQLRTNAWEKLLNVPYPVRRSQGRCGSLNSKTEVTKGEIEHLREVPERTLSRKEVQRVISIAKTKNS